MPEKETTEDLEREIRERKRYLRSKMRVTLRNAEPAWILKASRRIQDAVLRQPEFARANAIGLYLALPHEVQTSTLLQVARDQDKRVCVPAYNAENGRYELTWITRNDTLKPGPMKVPEPTSTRRAGFMDLDLLVVPAVAYDPAGGRLGHGGGHYDRILGSWSGLKVGIAFQFQIYDRVPMGSQDIPVDLVVTEVNVYREESRPDFIEPTTQTKQNGGAGPHPAAGRQKH